MCGACAKALVASLNPKSDAGAVAMWRNATIRAAAALDESTRATCIRCGITKTTAATVPRSSPRMTADATVTEDGAAAPSQRRQRGGGSRARRARRRSFSATSVAAVPASQKGAVVIAPSGPAMFYNIVRITNHATLSTWVPQRPAPVVTVQTDSGEVHDIVDVAHLTACDYLRTRGKSAKLSSRGTGRLHSCASAHHPAVLARWFEIASEQRIARDANHTARSALDAKLSVAASVWTPSPPHFNSASSPSPALSNTPLAMDAAPAYATPRIPTPLSRSSRHSPSQLPSRSPLPGAFRKQGGALARGAPRVASLFRATSPAFQLPDDAIDGAIADGVSTSCGARRFSLHEFRPNLPEFFHDAFVENISPVGDSAVAPAGDAHGVNGSSPAPTAAQQRRAISPFASIACPRAHSPFGDAAYGDSETRESPLESPIFGSFESTSLDEQGGLARSRAETLSPFGDAADEFHPKDDARAVSPFDTLTRALSPFHCLGGSGESGMANGMLASGKASSRGAHVRARTPPRTPSISARSSPFDDAFTLSPSPSFSRRRPSESLEEPVTIGAELLRRAVTPVDDSLWMPHTHDATDCELLASYTSESPTHSDYSPTPSVCPSPIGYAKPVARRPTVAAEGLSKPRIFDATIATRTTRSRPVAMDPHVYCPPKALFSFPQITAGDAHLRLALTPQTSSSLFDAEVTGTRSENCEESAAECADLAVSTAHAAASSASATIMWLGFEVGPSDLAQLVFDSDEE